MGNAHHIYLQTTDLQTRYAKGNASQEVPAIEIGALNLHLIICICMFQKYSFLLSKSQLLLLAKFICYPIHRFVRTLYLFPIKC